MTGKTGGGSGTNQFRIRGRAKERTGPELVANSDLTGQVRPSGSAAGSLFTRPGPLRRAVRWPQRYVADRAMRWAASSAVVTSSASFSVGVSGHEPVTEGVLATMTGVSLFAVGVTERTTHRHQQEAQNALSAEVAQCQIADRAERRLAIHNIPDRPSTGTSRTPARRARHSPKLRFYD
jgi:hypothetical protein